MRYAGEKRHSKFHLAARIAAALDVGSVVQFTRDKARTIRKDPKLGEMKMPANTQDWERYDEVILGRSRERLLELRDDKTRATPMTRLVSAWDRTWVLWLIAELFAADWHLRRRWGLC